MKAVVDGVAVAYDRAGEGAPTIVLIAGAGGDRTHFSAVFPSLAEIGTVVSYDRAGYGESDAAAGAEDGLGWRVRELHGLLAAVDAPRPYVLAGHSLGALIAQLYCLEHPHDLLAVVSVDGDDGIPTDLPPWPDFPPEVEMEAAAKLFANVPDSQRDKMLPSPTSFAAIAAESGGRQRAFDRLAAAREAGALPDVPFVHIGATGHFFGPDELLPISPVEIREKLLEKHERTAQAYLRGEFVEAAHSGHYIQFDQPDLVVKQIHRAVRRYS